MSGRDTPGLLAAAAGGAAVGGGLVWLVASGRVRIPTAPFWVRDALGLLPDAAPLVFDAADGVSRSAAASRPAAAARPGGGGASGRGEARASRADGRQVGVPRPQAGPDDVTRPLDMESDPILREHLTRNIQFFGEGGQRRISGSFVVVVGAGGVGSHAAHMLARAGVARLRVVDFDQVTLSSLNRHAVATRADVGTPKVEALAAHLTRIVPEVQVEAVNELFAEVTAGRHLAGSPDYVLDAIDNVETKAALLAACVERGVPVLASAGAGAKADPTRLRVTGLAESTADPLARAVRYRLRKHHGVTDGVKVLLSLEPPRHALVYGGQEDVAVSEYAVLPTFRAGTVPVLGALPALFGCAAAAVILSDLAGFPVSHEPVLALDERQYRTQFDRLEERERELGRDERDRREGPARRGGDGAGEAADAAGGAPVPLYPDAWPGVDEAEVRALVRHVWRNQSARSATGTGRSGLGKPIGDLTLTRWRRDRLPGPTNLVLLTRAEADAHDEAGGATDELRAREPEFVARVEAALERARLEFEDGLWGS